jgi:hypothetical protein
MQDFFGFDLDSVFRTQDQDEYVKQCLTSGFCNTLGIEAANPSGITHLYISGNSVSTHAVAHLLRIQRLHVLDVGSPIIERDRKRSIQDVLGGPEDLVPLLEKNGHKLSYLRLNHSVITKFTSPVAASQVAELDSAPPDHVATEPTGQNGFVELEGDYISAQEMPAPEPLFELEGSPVVEVTRQAGEPDESSQTTGTPNADVVEGTGREDIERNDTERNDAQEANHLLNPTDMSPRPLMTSRSRSNFAPEPLTLPESLVSPLLSPHGVSTPTMPPHGVSTPTITVSAIDEQFPPEESLGRRRPRTWSGLLADHDARIEYQKSQPHGLLPFMMPSLRTLVLTDIPSQFPTSDISQNIISFIRHCAEESHWSRRQSQVSYALPPNHRRESAEINYAKSLFALRRIVLEVKPYKDAGNLPARSPRRSGKSAVEDVDCETFWAAATDDFSFFDNGDEECGVPGSDMTQTVPLESRLGKMVVSDDEPTTPGSRPRSWGNAPIEANETGGVSMIDTLAEISRFRSAKRTLYQAAQQRGETDQFIEGHWDGEIIVIRNT